LRKIRAKLNALRLVALLKLTRRYLTSSQKATAAVEALPELEAEAKKRQIEAGKQHGRGHEKVNQKIDEPKSPQATEQAAQIFGTNRQYVSDAKIGCSKN